MIRDGSRDKLVGGFKKGKKVKSLKTKGKKGKKGKRGKRTQKKHNFENNNNKQLGGRVVKPSEFYGKSSDRYYSPGSRQLNPEDSAYGKTNAVSFGVTNFDMSESGPNLGPYPNSSGMMTGGSKRKRLRRRKKTKKSKRRC